MPTVAHDLDTPYALSAEQIARFRADGYIKLKQVLAPEVLAHYGERISQLVAERAKHLPPLASRGTYGKAFQQIINLWTVDEVARELMFSKRLARIAAELLGCAGVRMYHDQALYKEPGGGFTPWHCDQFYWPLSSPRSVTAWVPFQAVPLEMGPLEFATGSHRADFGRGLSIGDESERVIATKLSDLPKETGAFALGEVSYHYGWTFHRAGPNRTERMRRVQTIIYLDAEMRLAETIDTPERISDWKSWCPGVEPGAVIDSHLNPRLY